MESYRSKLKFFYILIMTSLIASPTWSAEHCDPPSGLTFTGDSLTKESELDHLELHRTLHLEGIMVDFSPWRGTNGNDDKNTQSHLTGTSSQSRSRSSYEYPLFSLDMLVVRENFDLNNPDGAWAHRVKYSMGIPVNSENCVGYAQLKAVSECHDRINPKAAYALSITTLTSESDTQCPAQVNVGLGEMHEWNDSRVATDIRFSWLYGDTKSDKQVETPVQWVGFSNKSQNTSN